MDVLQVQAEIVKLLQLPGPAVEVQLTLKFGTLPRVEVLYYVVGPRMRRIAYNLGDNGVRLDEEILEEIYG